MLADVSVIRRNDALIMMIYEMMIFSLPSTCFSLYHLLASKADVNV